MRRPRLSLRLAMLLVAVAAFGLGSWLQVRQWLRLRQDYQAEAWINGRMEWTARKNGNRTHEEWLADCQEIDRKNSESDVPKLGGHALFFGHPDPPDLERRRADHYARLRRKYERAACYPWLLVEPDPQEPR